jgi:hypothetical protein
MAVLTAAMPIGTAQSLCFNANARFITRLPIVQKQGYATTV